MLSSNKTSAQSDDDVLLVHETKSEGGSSVMVIDESESGDDDVKVISGSDCENCGPTEEEERGKVELSTGSSSSASSPSAEGASLACSLVVHPSLLTSHDSMQSSPRQAAEVGGAMGERGGGRFDLDGTAVGILNVATAGEALASLSLPPFHPMHHATSTLPDEDDLSPCQVDSCKVDTTDEKNYGWPYLPSPSASLLLNITEDESAPLYSEGAKAASSSTVFGVDGKNPSTSPPITASPVPLPPKLLATCEPKPQSTEIEEEFRGGSSSSASAAVSLPSPRHPLPAGAPSLLETLGHWNKSLSKKCSRVYYHRSEKELKLWHDHSLPFGWASGREGNSDNGPKFYLDLFDPTFKRHDSPPKGEEGKRIAGVYDAGASRAMPPPPICPILAPSPLPAATRQMPSRASLARAADVLLMAAPPPTVGGSGASASQRLF